METIMVDETATFDIASSSSSSPPLPLPLTTPYF